MSHFTNEETGAQNVKVIRIQPQPVDEIPKLELLSTIVKAVRSFHGLGISFFVFVLPLECPGGPEWGLK